MNNVEKISFSNNYVYINLANTGKTKKRSLHNDDINGIRAIY